MTKFGVIDLGTNTFHLLIVEAEGKPPFKELHRERRYIKLAENGIKKIGPAPFARGLAALQAFKSELDNYGVKKIKAIGTAALRTASNAAEFIRQVKASTNIEVQLISGKEEAKLIHLGVVQAVPFGKEKGLIMDIGGGSVEFIIADSEKVFWAQSFPVGVAVLFNRFHKNDPIEPAEVTAIENFLEKELQPLLEALQMYHTPKVIGASGSFEVVEEMVEISARHPSHTLVPVAQFFPLHKKILSSSLNQRLQMEGMPASRADLIVVAFRLMHFIICRAQIEEIIVSAYAMKEGVLREMMLND